MRVSPIDKTFEKEILKAAPSVAIAVLRKGRVSQRIYLGQRHKFYDLASLTKIMFTVPVFMELVEKNKIRLKDPIQKHLPWFPSKKTTVAEVLSHAGGLPWWLPLYKKIHRQGDWKLRRNEIEKYLRKIKISKSKKPIYSDVDFWILGFLMEAVTGQNLLQNFAKIKKQLGSRSLHFSVNNKPAKKRSNYAPTEKCPWRKKVLRGEVHDDNTRAFGGVSTHAGLFGSLNDVEKYGLWLRRQFRKPSRKKFFKRVGRSDWALGFMMPSTKGSSAGKYFSKTSVGHTGFTGTSLWYDPRRDLLIIVLSNRVHPTRKNLKFRELRPLIHDALRAV